MSLARIVNQNLCIAMRCYEAAARGAHLANDALSLTWSGTRYGVFNSALLLRPLPSAEELAACLQQAQRWFSQWDVPWSIWLCHDFLPGRSKPDLGRILRPARITELAEPPGMHTLRLAAPRRTLPPLDCVPVTDQRTRSDFAASAAAIFTLPFRAAMTIYTSPELWNTEIRGYVGYVGGQPVSISALVPCLETLGIYSVGTLPGFQRRGYAEALLRRALAYHEGYSQLVLQTTSAGERLYKNLGFEIVTRFTVYLVENATL